MFTEEQLRIALGNSLISLNKEVVNNKTEMERLLLNKFALKLIDNILKELHINIDG